MTRTKVNKCNLEFSRLFPPGKIKPKVVRHADYISLLGRTKNKKKRKQLIALADRDQVDAISEIIENVLRGTLVLTQTQHQRLRKYKKCMRQLVARRTALSKKKDYLKTYSGGFLPLLLSAALPIIGSLVKNLFPNKQ